MARKIEEDVPKAKINFQNLKDLGLLFSYIKPYQGYFVLGLVSIALSAVSTMSFPYLLSKMIDAAKVLLDGGDKGGISMWAWLIVLQLTLQIFFSFGRVYFFTRVGENATADMRKDVYAKMIQMPIDFFSNRRVGELSSRISADVSQIQDTVTLTFGEFLRGIVTIIIGITGILFVSTKLTLIMLSVVPLVVIIGAYFGFKIRNISRRTQDQLAESGTIVQETLQGISNVKIFTNEGFEINRYSKSLSGMVQTAIRNSVYRGLFISLMIFSIFGSILLVIWNGIQLVMAGELSIGTLSMFIIFTTFVGGTLAGFADIFSQLQKTLGATQRVRELLREQPEELDLNPTETPIRVKGDVNFSNVKFHYPSRPEVEVLRNINLHAAPGKKLAIVGSSGSGKSTLVQLLLRFFDVNSGSISIDGKPLSEMELTYLRSQISVVPQDVFLFGGSIADNIGYGKTGATLEEIMEAAKKANAHQFISSFPEGYQTLVGERGVKLSGGQRQRIAIARALLKDPAILVLDEATSSLDSESEKVVQQALEVLMENRTSIIIAHRLSTIRDADTIAVIDKGEIVESGTHNELMQLSGGIYRKLTELQNELEVIDNLV